MPKFLFAPRWLALHLAAVVFASGFAALGWWQLGVYQESQARLAERDRSPVPVTGLATAGQPLANAADRAVTAEGVYGDELVVPARVRDGVLGAYSVAVLDTPAGDLVVLRGWERDAADIAPAPTGDVTVTGHLLPAEVPQQATGASPAPTGQVRYIAADPVAEVTGRSRGEFYDGYLLVSSESPEPADPPERLEVSTVSPVRDVSPWQNLSYWAQWWVFAAAVLVFWFSFVRAALKKRNSPPDPGARPEPEPPPSVPQRTTSAG